MQVVSGCKEHLRQGKSTWQRTSELLNLVNSISNIKELQIFTDLHGYTCLTTISETLKGSDIILIHCKEYAFIIELTCGSITDVKENSSRKQNSYN